MLAVARLVRGTGRVRHREHAVEVHPTTRSREGQVSPRREREAALTKRIRGDPCSVAGPVRGPAGAGGTPGPRGAGWPQVGRTVDGGHGTPGPRTPPPPVDHDA